MKKNILIVSYSYPPNNVAGAQRPYALAKFLDKSKYNVTVLTCANPDLPLGENKHLDPSLEHVDLIKINSKVGGNSTKNLRESKKAKTTKSTLKSIVFKVLQWFVFPDKAMFWYPNVKTYLLDNPKLIEESHIVFSSSPGLTNHNIAKFIKSRNKEINWVADFRDFNYVGHWEGKFGIKAFLHKKLEKQILTNANSLTFVTQSMLEAYKKAYPIFENKMFCVFNGLDINEYRDFTASHLKNDKISIFYAGTFYGGIRSPFPLFEILDSCLEKGWLQSDDFIVKIAGIVPDEMKEELSKFKSYSSVSFLGNLPRANVLELMTSTTFLWLIVGNIKSHYQTIPIKLFEYIAARRPILNFAPNQSDCTKIISELKLGYSFNTLGFNLYESLMEFEEVLKRYNKGYFSEPLSISNLEYFNWSSQIKKMEKLLEK